MRVRDRGVEGGSDSGGRWDDSTGGPTRGGPSSPPQLDGDGERRGTVGKQSPSLSTVARGGRGCAGGHAGRGRPLGSGPAWWID